MPLDNTNCPLGQKALIYSCLNKTETTTFVGGVTSLYGSVAHCWWLCIQKWKSCETKEHFW